MLIDCGFCAVGPGLEFIKLESILKLKIKRNDWCCLRTQSVHFILSLRLFYNLEARLCVSFEFGNHHAKE